MSAEPLCEDFRFFSRKYSSGYLAGYPCAVFAGVIGTARLDNGIRIGISPEARAWKN
jgi:hypothetical protein